MKTKLTKMGLLASLLLLNGALLALDVSSAPAQTQDRWCTIEWQGRNGTCVCSPGLWAECPSAEWCELEVAWCHDY